MENDENSVIENSWNKLKNTAEKKEIRRILDSLVFRHPNFSGYRDGISKGRELNYQNSFDDGYSQGFKTGFILGSFKGVLSVTGTIPTELDKTSRGNCNVCTNKELETKSIPEIISIQTNDSNNLLMKLHEKYPTKINIPNKI